MRVVILIMLFFTSLACAAQRDGFEVLRIGKSFFDQSINDDYEQQFTDPDSLVFRITAKVPKYICNELIDYLNIKTNRDSSITEIELYTVARMYQKDNDFTNNYRSISQCMVSDFGKPDYLNDGSRNKDKMKTAAWTFADTRTMFVLYTYELPVDPNVVKRFYKMIWRTYNPGDQKPMW